MLGIFNAKIKAIGTIQLIMEEQLYSLSEIYRNRIAIGGKPRTLVTLQKIAAEENVPCAPQVGFRGAKLYKLEVFEEYYKKYEERIHGGKVTGKSNRKLIEEKLTEQIDRLRQDKILADLKIEEMKKNLIAAEEVANFLQLRYGVENALLRRILFVNAPIEVPGLEVVKARNKCEEYFLQIQDVLMETLKIWQETHSENGEFKVPENVQKVIDKLNDAMAVKQ